MEGHTQVILSGLSELVREEGGRILICEIADYLIDEDDKNTVLNLQHQKIQCHPHHFPSA